MEKIRLGSSDLAVPQICIGTWAWGLGYSAGNEVFGHRLELKELEPVFRAATDAGLPFYDTASIFGFGAAERLLGRLLPEGKRREWYTISTKFTPTPWRLFAGKLRKELKRSLRRLGLERLSLYLLHSPAKVRMWLPLLADLANEGLIRAIGVANFNLAQVREADIYLRSRGLRLHAVQNHYSLLYRSHEQSGLLDWCREQEISFLSYMVLEQGVLAGKFSVDSPPPRRSRRGRAYGAGVLRRVGPLLEALAELGARHDRSQAEIAVTWALEKGCLPIVGVTAEPQVESLLRAFDTELTDDEVGTLEAAADRTGLVLPAQWDESG